ncbi:beta-lactamase family protein [Herbidospora galbida]|uniref:Beta-lactamase family protein n=1 Tax=Herbidospora galbida TaxID=2575442 RepID=A0A4U3MFI2_9ACTN|nr:serine hydrolase domain-containing protein [Herbidospora galbida]TKK88035.1 beta-lactamase family protein [Herbidospora galbida]
MPGTTAPGFEPVLDAFEDNFAHHDEIGAAVCVYVNGEKVVDLWGGSASEGRPWTEDTLQVVFSTTKAITAACALHLVDRGLLDLDAPVAAYWPEFGKPDIPVRWLLTHQAGLAALDTPVTPAEAIAWKPVVAALEAQQPLWEPGTESGYHAHTFGWLVGEVVRRVSGRSLGTYLREEITGPLGLDFWIGLPASEYHRAARIISPKIDMSVDPATLPEALRPYFDPTSLTMRASMAVTPFLDHNDPAELAAEFPSSNGAGTARGLAGFYAALLDGRILSPGLLALATTEQVNGVDKVLRVPVRIGLGFGLPTPDMFWHGPTAFGFSGHGGSLGFADPARGLAFGYVMNHGRDPITDKRAENLVRAVLASLC